MNFVGPTSNATTPNADGTWPPQSRRLNVLKHALRQVFNDKQILPDDKIRLAWQAMSNNGNDLFSFSNFYWYWNKDIPNAHINPGRGKTPGAGNVGSGNKNGMRTLDETHRANFMEFVNYLAPEGNTPSHKMFKQVDEYLRANINGEPIEGGPWATNPGGTDEKSKEFIGCRRSYHIMMTDGQWNDAVSGGNQESTPTTFPDGTTYSPNSEQTKVYYDDYPDTLADWAFYSWSNNLQPSIYSPTDTKKQLPLSSEYKNAPSTEKIGDIEVEKYWNPKYNPATWPHVVTYTIGFSKTATEWIGVDHIKPPTQKTPFGYDGSFPDFISGKATWPDLEETNKRPLDLWHAAINGRGRYYAVTKADDLEKAFREIILRINSYTEPDRNSLVLDRISDENSPVRGFVTRNWPGEAWKGEVEGFQSNASGRISLWGGKTTAKILDETLPENRTIITWGDNLSPGKPFRWNELSEYQQQCLSIDPNNNTPADCLVTGSDAYGEARLNYIRGERRQETAAGGQFRNRHSKQGDIVNSSIWYTGAPISNYAYKGYFDFTRTHKDRLPLIYVGGNDGMLHGFSANDGSEKIAYIPRAVIPNLTRLTWPSFDDNHRYFVDGSPMTGDVDIKYTTSTPHTPDWRTMLVGTLGAGGKGYFVLDVTQPSDFSEKNAANLVVMDKTMHSSEHIPCVYRILEQGQISCLDHTDADIGHIFAKPSTDDNNPLRTGQITLLNNNRWAVILGNGYNSKNGRPVLLIQYLDGNKELIRLPATKTNETGKNVDDNGLSAPRLVDINSDDRPDVVYAGDLKGNMWKFMIASPLSTEWGVAFNYKPLFTAKGGKSASPDIRNTLQEITSPPTVRANDRTVTTGTGNNKKILSVGGLMVAFGTGRNVTLSDPKNTDIQTLYSVLDNTRYEVSVDSKTKLSHVRIHQGDNKKSIPAPTPLGDGLNNNFQQVKLAKQVVGQYHQGKNNSADREFWNINQTSDSAATSVDWNNQYGWYLDLPDTGERLLEPMKFYDGSNILEVYTEVPAKALTQQNSSESCEVSEIEGERKYLTLLNMMDGKRPSVQLMDLSGDGFYDLTIDQGVSRARISKGAHKIIFGEKGGKVDDLTLARMPEQSIRPNWRQLK